MRNGAGRRGKTSTGQRRRHGIGQRRTRGTGQRRRRDTGQRRRRMRDTGRRRRNATGRRRRRATGPIRRSFASAMNTRGDGRKRRGRRRGRGIKRRGREPPGSAMGNKELNGRRVARQMTEARTEHRPTRNRRMLSVHHTPSHLLANTPIKQRMGTVPTVPLVNGIQPPVVIGGSLLQCQPLVRTRYVLPLYTHTGHEAYVL